MPEVRRSDGETLCQARQQSGQGFLELQQIHRNRLYRQPKHTESVGERDAKDVKGVKDVKDVRDVRDVRDVNYEATNIARTPQKNIAYHLARK